MTTELLILNHHLSNRVFDFSSERFGVLRFPLSRCCVSGTGCQQFSASLLRRWYKTVSKFFRNLAAERQRPQEAHQVESGNKIWQAVFCAARAASSAQARPMAGQGRSPCGLGGSKGGHSSDKNGPLSLCCAFCSNCCKTRSIVKGGHSYRKNDPLSIPQDRKGCALDPPLVVPAQTMLHALRKKLPAKFCCRFRLDVLLAAAVALLQGYERIC